MILMSMALLLAACSKPTGEAAESTAGSIAITDFAERTVTFSKAPENIAALGSGDVDLMHAFGKEVVGKPTLSDDGQLAEMAKDAEEIGTTHEVNYEKIALLQPDVVIANVGFNQEDVPTIEGLGTKVILTEANSISDIKKQINLYGEMLQETDKAAQLMEELDAELKAAASELEDKGKRVLLVYGAPGTYMAALPNSLSGDFLAAAGGVNVASDYPALEKFPQYAQINTERVVEANPDAVLLITHGDAEEIKQGFLKEMKQNAAWTSLDAVKNDRVEVLPSDLFGTNPGTRAVDAVQYLVELLNHLE
ncbi:ABC transporter substrate-binding protein [Niallia circulans]|uniref:ABC transporter substrate-binding protein n=2 Tax=Niallia circulans TaxID=1397 RepID=A0A553SPV5_NIACI|nr:ABC transporter substrate-binding protein [Niallia circulans]